MELDFLLSLALILIVTKIFGLITRRAHLPQVVGALLAGIILGPAILGIIQPDYMMTTLSEIGAVLIMFSAGLGTDFKQLRGVLKASMTIAVLGAAVAFAGGLALALFFGQNTLQSVFVGVVLTATSVGINVEALQEMGKLKTKAGTTILGAAVIDDILGIIILSVMMGMGLGLGAGDVSHMDALLTLLRIFVFFIIAVILGLGAFKLFEYLSIKMREARGLPIFGLAFCFFMAFLSDRFGVGDVIGAYIAGLVLCNSKAEKHILEKSTILSFMFFSPIFFVSVGLNTSFAGLGAGAITFTILLLVVAVVSKLLGCGFGAFICGYSKEESAQVSVGMISRGEVAIIIATQGVGAGLMNADLFSSVIFVVVATTLISPVLLKKVFNFKNRSISPGT